jgi:hypothetical protein
MSDVIAEARNQSWETTYEGLKTILVEDIAMCRTLVATSKENKDIHGGAIAKVYLNSSEGLLILVERLNLLHQQMERVTMALDGINKWIARYEPFLKKAQESEDRYLKP